MRKCNQICYWHFFNKAAHFKIGLMTFENYSGCTGDGIFIVAQTRAIGRSHFLETAAGLSDDIRQTKAATDFYQLAPRHNYVFTARQSCDREHYGGGIVVDGNSRLAAGDER